MNSQSSRTPAGRQRGFLSSRQAFVLLGLLFMAPTFVAWVMHHSSEQGWRPEGMTNRGTLVHPARPLQPPQDLQVNDQPLSAYLNGFWTMVYVGDDDCDAVCNGDLYKMRQVRVAQNENMKRVQLLYLMQGEVVPQELSRLLATEYTEMTLVPMRAEQAEVLLPQFAIDETPVLDAGRVYYVDPLGNLMMYYTPDADPRDMLKDLQKLLKYSKIG